MANRNGSAPSSRYHIVLIPGFGGFDALGRVEYYAGITERFQQWQEDHQVPAVLHYFDNLPTASVVTRAARLRKYLAKRRARGEMLPDDKIVLVGHSTGGLDIRQLIWDLHHAGKEPIPVDGGLPVEPKKLLKSIDGVVFLSVPHWGTNIAEWVYQHTMLRKMVIADLRAAYAGSQVFLVDELEAAMADTAAAFIGADILLALRDTLTEANADWNGPDPTRVSDAQEAASELELYFRQMGTNFSVIEDLSPRDHDGLKSPAQFSPEQRTEELRIWKASGIRTRSYATVGGRAFEFDTGFPAPVFNLTNLADDLQVSLAHGSSARTDLSYRLCYRACAGGPLTNPGDAADVTRVLGPEPPRPLQLWDNDGIVNTVSMLWPSDEIVLVQADHLDVVGHYRLRPEHPKEEPLGEAPPRVYESYDTLKSAPQFAEKTFNKLWDEIFSFAANSTATRSRRLKVAATTGA